MQSRPDEFDEQVAALARGPRQVDPAEIVEVVESVMASVSGDLSTVNHDLFHEIEALAGFIRTAKAEVASLRPDEIKNRHLATAADELEVIVDQTEVATNSIVTAAETIEQLCEEMEPALAEKVTKAVTAVYEACGFQDLTGQRIGKVVAALQHIEHRIEGLLQAFGTEFEAGGQGDAKPSPSPLGPPPGKAARPDEDLMSGPQKPGEAKTQDEIDALLGFD